MKKQIPLKFEQISHTADIGLRIFGKDMKELFENAALGMFSVMADIEGMKTSVEKEFSLCAASKEELLVAWLDELLYNFYTKSILFSAFQILSISSDDLSLTAKANGRPVGENRNRLLAEIKAVTFHNLEIKKNEDRYSVEVIFDV